MSLFWGGRSAYRVLADILRAQIESGELAPGDRLPSSKDIERQWDVSRVVGQMAVDILKSEGLVIAHPGKGVYVRRPPTRRYLVRDLEAPLTAPVRDQGNDLTWTSQTEQGAATNEYFAGRLGVSLGARIVITRYTGSVDGSNVQILTSWEPLERIRDTPIVAPESGAVRGVVARYATIGVVVDRIDAEAGTRMPNELERRVLRVAPAVPVLVFERTHRAQGVIVETADLVVPGDRYRLRTRPQNGV